MKTKNLWIISISIFMVSCISCGIYFFQQKVKFNKLTLQSQKLNQMQEQKIKTLLDSYKLKYAMIKATMSTLENKKQQANLPLFKEINLSISRLETFEITDQTSLDNFETYNNKLNQLLVAEIIKFNTKQKSLFNNISEIRNLERFDKHIDDSRTKYSHWSLEYNKVQEATEKNFFNKVSIIKVPFFKVDHLILAKKGLTQTSRSAAL